MSEIQVYLIDTLDLAMLPMLEDQQGRIHVTIHVIPVETVSNILHAGSYINAIGDPKLDAQVRKEIEGVGQMSSVTPGVRMDFQLTLSSFAIAALRHKGRITYRLVMVREEAVFDRPLVRITDIGVA